MNLANINCFREGAKHSSKATMGCAKKCAAVSTLSSTRAFLAYKIAVSLLHALVLKPNHSNQYTRFGSNCCDACAQSQRASVGRERQEIGSLSTCVGTTIKFYQQFSVSIKVIRKHMSMRHNSMRHMWVWVEVRARVSLGVIKSQTQGPRVKCRVLNCSYYLCRILNCRVSITVTTKIPELRHTVLINK